MADKPRLGQEQEILRQDKDKDRDKFKHEKAPSEGRNSKSRFFDEKPWEAS